jgi:regulator of protease activity HflC (stomatin/prohibitin superfamily)
MKAPFIIENHLMSENPFVSLRVEFTKIPIAMYFFTIHVTVYKFEFMNYYHSKTEKKVLANKWTLVVDHYEKLKQKSNLRFKTVNELCKVFHVTRRDITGKHELADLLQDREKIAEDLQKTLDTNTNPWGITCQTVGIRDIIIPQALADAMSKQAQAERERKARVILGTAETEIAEKFAKASEQYANNPIALHLRGMNMLYEGLKEKGSMVIVPSSALDSMNLGVIGGLVSLAKDNIPKKE